MLIISGAPLDEWPFSALLKTLGAQHPHQISIGVDAIPVLVPTLTTTLGLRVIVMKENKYWMA